MNIRYDGSFANYIEVELGLNLNDIWNWEKNNELDINPYEIRKQANKKVWLYCLENDYHNYDREGNKIGYEISCNNFYRGNRCGYCYRRKVHYKDSLAYNYPNVAKMIAISENNLTFDDCYCISCHSGKRFYFQCLDCESISTKRKSLDSIIKKGYSCEYCSDGISIPNKFITNVLNQLDEDFITELSSKKFNGKNYFRYDFYLFKINSIIEANGLQHYEECSSLTKRSLEQEQMNDLFKYKCAKNHINNYIVIDCRYSTLEWLKENIIKELSPYFNLNNINWELAWEESQNSLCVKSWELWNSGIHDIIEISKILNITRNTTTIYLKCGVECGKCTYTSEESRKSGVKKMKCKTQNPIICLTTKRLFLSAKIGSEYYNASYSHVCACCNGRDDRAGEFNKLPLVWRYVNVKHSKTYRIKDKINYNPNINCRIVDNILKRERKLQKGKSVVCIETGEVFISVSHASRSKKVDRKSINLSIKKGYKAGGYHWKEFD